MGRDNGKIWRHKTAEIMHLSMFTLDGVGELGGARGRRRQELEIFESLECNSLPMSHKCVKHPLDVPKNLHRIASRISF